MTRDDSVSADDGSQPPCARLPFFVYGTLRPGGRHHDAYLGGRFLTEEPGLLADTLLYEGPGYPYAVRTAGAGPVRGSLVTPCAEHYARVLADLDRLEGHRPGADGNLYDRVALDVLRGGGGSDADSGGAVSGVSAGEAVRAWVYVAPPELAGRLRADGTPVPGGDWSG